MTWVMVDVEADGPCPGQFSMIALGAVTVEPGLGRTFNATLKPFEHARYLPEALAVSGFTREETLRFEEPVLVMSKFRQWLNEIARPMFVSDNNGFDWQFVNYYLWFYTSGNPFGHSSTNLGSLYKGMVRDMKKNFKHLRKTKHTHDPLQDAIGNAEALLSMQELGLKIEL